MFPQPEFYPCNELSMAVYEQGEGDVVLFLHGFPELAYSWRHQLPAVAAAGFRAVAPDLRGYGRTGGPDDVAKYDLMTLIGDVNALLDALDVESATIVGHDWGALLMWHFAMHSPHRVQQLIGLNIPHVPRPPADPISLFRQRFGDDFYIVNFQDSDEADRRFAADPRHFFSQMMRKNQLSREVFDTWPDEMKVLSLLRLMDQSEASGDAILSEAELQYYVDAFSNSGFSGPINWYRNWSKNWSDFEHYDHTITHPILFIAAADDLVVGPEHVAAMSAVATDLTVETLQPCGHWSQQERPLDINRLILERLAAR